MTLRSATSESSKGTWVRGDDFAVYTETVTVFIPDTVPEHHRLPWDKALILPSTRARMAKEQVLHNGG